MAPDALRSLWAEPRPPNPPGPLPRDWVLVAALALLARDYQQRQRIASALEAEQLVHAPTLGTIPVKR